MRTGKKGEEQKTLGDDRRGVRIRNYCRMRLKRREGGREGGAAYQEEIFVHVMRLLVSRCLLVRLEFEALPLIHRVRELRKAIGELATHDEELEALRVARFTAVGLGQRANFLGVIHDESGLNQFVLAQLLETLVQNLPH